LRSNLEILAAELNKRLKTVKRGNLGGKYGNFGLREGKSGGRKLGNRGKKQFSPTFFAEQA
jgi:hypothetical protein